MMLLKKIWHKTKEILARVYLKLYPNLTVIGVTGSVGKTTTKEAIAQVLAEKFKVKKSEANLDPIFNIPQTILKLRPGDEKLVLEMGVEYPKEMDYYLSLVRPQIGVLTKIDWTHTEFFGDINGVADEKKKLLKALPSFGWQVINWDDQKSRELAKSSRAKIFFFGTNDHNCQVVAEDVKTNKDGLSFLLRQTWNDRKIFLKLPLFGRHNLYAALAAASVGIISEMTLEEIKRGLEKLKPSVSRLNVILGVAGATIIDDSYNASPIGTIAAIETLKDYPGKRKIAVLGEMKELGSFSQEGHLRVGEKIVENEIDYLIVFGDLTRFIIDGASKAGMNKAKIFKAKTMNEIIKILKDLLEADDVILLKGSRFAHMERVILGLKGQKISCDLMTCKKYATCSTCKKIAV